MTVDDQQQVVTQIGEALGETEEEPLAQIGRIVSRCGSEDALTWLQEAQEIEASEGMLLPDKSRRRTPGGVYFKLVREKLKTSGRKKLIQQIFKWRYKKDGDNLQSFNAPPPPPFSWEDRGQLMDEARAGKATTVKITVIGRPGKAVERPGFSLILMKRSAPLPPLPKGVPVPPGNPETDYIVYIGAKQWTKVKESLKQPEDVLIIEGTPILDPKFNAITVFATNVTTKLLQQAMRQTT